MPTCLPVVSKYGELVVKVIELPVVAEGSRVTPVG